MAEAVKFPDTTKVVIGILSAVHGDVVPVVNKVPRSRPGTFVRVQRTGGVRRTDVSDAARVVVESWAPTQAEANELAELNRAILAASAQTDTGLAFVYRVDDVQGVTEIPDVVTDTPRADFTVAVHLRGSTYVPPPPPDE